MPYQLISASNDDALTGSRMYGATAEPSTFDPPCDAFARRPSGASYFRAVSANNSAIFAELEFSPLAAAQRNPYPLDFYRNMTNQPSFGNGSTCDNQIRLFNTSLSQGRFAPVPVVGKVVADLPPFRGRQGLGDVHGFEVATPFIENNFLACESLRGYGGVDLPGY